MAVPWNPEPLESLRARYQDALVTLYDHRAIAAGDQQRPSSQAQHVFDWTDGLRLIVSRDRVPDGRTGICISGSFQRHSQVTEKLIQPDVDPVEELCVMMIRRWQVLAESERTPQLLALSVGKGVPHLVVWDDH